MASDAGRARRGGGQMRTGAASGAERGGGTRLSLLSGALIALRGHPGMLARGESSGVRTPCGSGRRNHRWGVAVAHAFGGRRMTNLPVKQAHQDLKFIQDPDYLSY